MVRNIKGGSKHKKLARKNVDDEQVVKKTRLANPDEECEMYAKVTKLFGNGMTEVICNDGVYRICIIRNKFRGRNKRNNNVSEQTLVLVGLRDWEVVAADKKPKCDLLEVYTTIQHKDIQKDPRSDWRYLKPMNSTDNEEVHYDDNGNQIVEDAFEFADVDINDI